MTCPDEQVWPAAATGYRRSEITAVISPSTGAIGVWERATEQVLRWGVKTASRFTESRVSW
ncbi:hypothetical protein [Arthrobacter sp. D5-1]|uniref:hypothetical protein n=1 Tax=Arthrobacter sp. D5-1 TaxID=1477518 RepID=UPI001A98AAFC|nr:hypothetical protein [Arthrobacter sp. D5-1]